MASRTRMSLLSCVLALAIAGCGSGDGGTIPPDDADNLLNLLSAVQTEADQGQCDLAQGHAQELVNEINALPTEVDPKVAGELTRAAGNLDQLAQDPAECTATGASGELGDQSSTSTTETVAPPTTTETTTQEEPTTTLQEPDQQPTEPDQSPTGGGQNQTPPAGGGGGGGPASGGITGGGSAG